MSKKILKIGTRGSDLALFQTRSVAKALSAHGLEAAEEVITTRGDKDYRPFQQITGDGFFTKELERAMLEGRIEMAVHSAKDLPSMVHADLPWRAFSAREETADILIARKGVVLHRAPLDIKAGSKIGTSSPRRIAQLRLDAPNIEVLNLRGNVPTRINKVADGTLDGAVLAKAGVKRLGLLEGLAARGLEAIELDWVTAPCQGVIAVQTHREHLSALSKIDNSELDVIAKTEKSLLALLGGGCHLALGAHIEPTSGGYRLRSFFADEKSAFSETVVAKRIGDLVREYVAAFVGADLAPASTATTHDRVWLTQPLQNVLKPAKRLAQHQLTPVVWPLTEVAPTWKTKDLASVAERRATFGAVAFSSQFAVQIFLTELQIHWSTGANEKDNVSAWLNSKKVFAVGPATRRRLEEFGVRNVITSPESEGAHAEALVKEISRHPFAGGLLLPGQSGAVLRESVSGLSSPVETLDLYKVLPSTHRATSDVPEVLSNDVIVLTSPSAAREFVLWCERNPALKRLGVWAFGPSTSRELTQLKIPHQVNPVSGSWDDLIDTLQRSK